METPSRRDFLKLIGLTAAIGKTFGQNRTQPKRTIANNSSDERTNLLVYVDTNEEQYEIRGKHRTNALRKLRDEHQDKFSTRLFNAYSPEMNLSNISLDLSEIIIEETAAEYFRGTYNNYHAEGSIEVINGYPYHKGMLINILNHAGELLGLPMEELYEESWSRDTYGSSPIGLPKQAYLLEQFASGTLSFTDRIEALKQIANLGNGLMNQEDQTAYKVTEKLAEDSNSQIVIISKTEYWPLSKTSSSRLSGSAINLWTDKHHQNPWKYVLEEVDKK